MSFPRRRESREEPTIPFVQSLQGPRLRGDDGRRAELTVIIVITDTSDGAAKWAARGRG